MLSYTASKLAPSPKRLPLLRACLRVVACIPSSTGRLRHAAALRRPLPLLRWWRACSTCGRRAACMPGETRDPVPKWMCKCTARLAAL